MTIAKGQTVTMENREGSFRVLELWGQEDGLLTLKLQPEEGAPFTITDVDVCADGSLYTEGLERIEQAAAPIVETELPEGFEPCRSCRKPIRWTRTAAGKRTPVNPDGSTHWGTCPQAPTWSRKKSAPVADEPVAQAADQLNLF